MVNGMCGPLENDTRRPHGVGNTLKLFACFAPCYGSQESSAFFDGMARCIVPII